MRIIVSVKTTNRTTRRSSLDFGDGVKTQWILEHEDVGGVLAAPRLFTCTELRGERATYNRGANLRALVSPRVLGRAT